MNQPLKSAALTLSLCIAVVGCGRATIPTTESAAPGPSVTNEGVVSETGTPQVASSSSDMNAGLSDNLGSLASLKTQSIQYKIPKIYTLDQSGGCFSVNNSGNYLTCVSKDYHKFVELDYGPSNFDVVYLSTDDLVKFCTSHLDGCKWAAKNTLKYIYSQTKPGNQCFNNRRLQQTLFMKAVKLGILATGGAAVAVNSKLQGNLIADLDTSWKEVLGAAGNGAVGAIVAEWSFSYAYTQGWNPLDAGHTGALLKVILQVASGLPSYFHVTQSAQVGPAIQQTCPANYAIAFEHLPV